MKILYNFKYISKIGIFCFIGINILLLYKIVFLIFKRLFYNFQLKEYLIKFYRQKFFLTGEPDAKISPWGTGQNTCQSYHQFSSRQTVNHSQVRSWLSGQVSHHFRLNQPKKLQSMKFPNRCAQRQKSRILGNHGPLGRLAQTLRALYRQEHRPCLGR